MLISVNIIRAMSTFAYARMLFFELFLQFHFLISECFNLMIPIFLVIFPLLCHDLYVFIVHFDRMVLLFR